MEGCQQVRRPLAGLALSVVFGLWLQQWGDLPALLMLGLSAIALSLCAVGGRQRSGALVYGAAALVAAAFSAVESVPVPSDSALPVAETQSAVQEIAGTVEEDPEQDEDDAVAVFRFRADAVRFPDGWRPADATVRVQVRDTNEAFVFGERLRLTGRFRSYNGVYGGACGGFYTDESRVVRVREAPLSFRRICYQIRRRASAVLSMGLEQAPAPAGLLQALLLGYRHELSDALYQTFSRTGTLHIFAISGLHVGVMAAILIAVLKILGVSKPAWGVYLIPLLFFYVVSTGMKPSAFRAFTMASVYFAAPLMHRKPDPVSAIALAALILLALNPLQLSDPGFLLSFTVVCGIVMVHHAVGRRLRGRIYVGRVVWARPGGSHPASAGMRTVGMLALTSLAAWLFSVPLTAFFFHTVSPVALAGNLLIIPLTFMIVLTGCFSLLFAPLFLPASVLFNQANQVFISLLLFGIDRMESLPGAYRFVRAPSFSVSACWYIGLVLLFAGPPRLRKAGCVAALCAALFWGWTASHVRGPSGLTVAREADCAALVSSSAEPQLLAVQGDAYSLRRAARLLKKNGINRLPQLAVTGPRMDADGLAALCGIISIERVTLPASFRGESALYESNRFASTVEFADQFFLPFGSGTLSLDLTAE